MTAASPRPPGVLPACLTRPATPVTAYNEAIPVTLPAFQATPQSVQDVQEVVAFCRARGLRLSPCATGHDFEGRSLSGDVILHLSAFRAVKYDPRTTRVTIGGGAVVYDINQVLHAHGRAISTGTNQDVGITGLTLGGGAAYTSRQHGLTCDALLAADLVTFTGEHLHVTDDSHPDLMRLLRGAGGGHFGVVTALTFRTYPTTPVLTFHAHWPLDGAAPPIDLLEERLISAPDSLSMRVGANVTGPDRARQLTLSGQCFSGSATVDRHFGALRRHAHWTEQTLPYAEAMAGARHQTAGGAFKIKSRHAFTPVGGGLNALLDHLLTWTPTTNPDGAGFGLFAWGGAVRHFPPQQSCVPGRQSEYLASFDTAWTARDTPALTDGQLRWVHDLDALAGTLLSSCAYVNFPDSDDQAFQARHQQPFLADLQAWTARLDPDRLGRQVSLAPSWPPAPSPPTGRQP